MVSNNVMVTLFCVELDREASHIANCVRTALLTTSGAEAEENWRLLADSVKELGASQLSNVLVGDFEFAPGARRLGMHDSIGR